MLLNLAATVLAAPLLAESGFGLVGAVSVAACATQAVLAATLPADRRAPRMPNPTPGDGRVDRHDPAEPTRAAADESEATAAADDPAAPDEPDGEAGFLTMLRAGLGEAIRVRAVRHALVLAVLLPVFGVLDEYFGLLARDMHTSTDAVPLLVSSTVAAQAIGAFAARRCPTPLGRRPPSWRLPCASAAAPCSGSPSVSSALRSATGCSR